MSFDGPMFSKPAVPQVNDTRDEGESPFLRPDMTFGRGIADMVSRVKDSYSREASVAGAALAVGMVLSGRNTNWEHEADAYANV